MACCTSKKCPRTCGPPCVAPPPLQQGAVMPVLYQPASQTDLRPANNAVPSTYTLNIITTQYIPVGTLFRFEMWNAASFLYSAVVGTGNLALWDLVVTKAIPAGTVLVVAVETSGTALYGYTGRTIYAQGGAGVAAQLFGPYNSTICFGYTPTASNGYGPAMPMFAIGYNYASEPGQMGTLCDAAVNPGAQSATMPNFPDQYQSGPYRWTFEYEVVYPIYQVVELVDNTGSVCVTPVPGIKFVLAAEPFVAYGSWSTLRQIITQPWTILKDNYYSVTNWKPYTDAIVAWKKDSSPDVGPFIVGGMAGQLAVVYFSPRYKNINTDSTPATNPPNPFAVGAAEVAFLVTSPIYPYSRTYFSIDEYNQTAGGFGPRDPLLGDATFVYNQPSFTWVAGQVTIPAGTVVVFRNIGHATLPITVQNAHNTSADVGAVIDNLSAGQAVVSIMALALWNTTGVGSARPLPADVFITAALSDQYAGDMPPLSPMYTINKSVFTGPMVYGQGSIFDNVGLPGTVQAALINAAQFAQLTAGASVPNAELPVFRGMQDFYW